MRLVQIVFGLVLAQSLLLYRDVVLHPFLPGNWVSALALGAVYTTTVLSWIDWHITMEVRPYNFSASHVHGLTEKIRLGVDLFIVTTYAYLLFTVEALKQPGEYLGGYLLAFPIIFGAYLLSGLARRRSHGKLATNPTPILWFGGAYLALYFLYEYTYETLVPRLNLKLSWLNLAGVVLGLGLMVLYRMVRSSIVSRRYKCKRTGLLIGVDVDGVLANQIHGIVPRVRARLGIELEYRDVTDWRLPLGDSDIAREIEIAFEDPEYVLSMPVHPGARDLVDTLYVNNIITLITARPPATKPWTLQWLQNHGFTYDDLVNVKEQKKSLYRTDVLIDDYIGNVKEYLENTTGVAILVDQPWNRRERQQLERWIGEKRLYVTTNLRDAANTVHQIKAQRLTTNRSGSRTI